MYAWNPLAIFVYVLTAALEKEKCTPPCICGRLGCEVTSMRSTATNGTSVGRFSSSTLGPTLGSDDGSRVGLDVVVGCVVAIIVFVMLVAVSAFACKRRRMRNESTAQPRNQYGVLSLRPPADYADIVDVRAPANRLDTDHHEG